MSRNTQAGLSTLLLIMSVIGFSVNTEDVATTVDSVFALIVGMLGAYNSVRG